MSFITRQSRAHLAVVCMALAAGPSQAGIMDFLFGTSKAEPSARQADPRRKSWRIGEFSGLRLVPSEAGAAPNTQPATVTPSALRDLLSPIRVPVGAGSEPLFGREELDDLIESLAEALQVAGPREDVLLVSSNRRGGGLLAAPTAVTARLFVAGGGLNLIVHDTRFDFFGVYRGSGKEPEFVYGSRNAATTAAIERPGAVKRRGDWLEVPVLVAAATAPPGSGGPAATAAAALPAPATPAAGKPRDAAFFEEQEQRLAALKRLRERGLITEDEYQQKRAEILKLL